MTSDPQGAAGGEDPPETPIFRVEAPARYCKRGDFEGTGSVTELSKRELRIGAATLRVAIGEQIRVSFPLMRGSVPITLPCVVARVWDGGFAAEFAEISARDRNALYLALAQLKGRRLSGDETGLTILRSSSKRSKRDPV